MNILSILWGKTSTACLLIDGTVVACVSEERFTRQKNDDRFPQHSITFCLEYAGLEPRDIDEVVFCGEYWSPRYILTRRFSKFTTEDRFLEQKLFWEPQLSGKSAPSYYELFRDKIDLDQYPGDWESVIEFEDRNNNSNKERGHYDIDSKSFYQKFVCQTISNYLGVPTEKIVFVHHHRGHTDYAYWSNPCRPKNALVFSIDGWGDDMNATVSRVDKGVSTRIAASTNFFLGRLYRSMTQLLGMKPDEHEYKIMGLAGYAKREHYLKLLDEFRKTQVVNGLDFDFIDRPKDIYEHFRSKTESYRFDSIAGALQEYTEEILCQWTGNAIDDTNLSHVMFGGGVAMNMKAMMKIGELDNVETVFVPATPSDESLPIGCAYARYYDKLLRQGRDPNELINGLSEVYLGPEVDRSQVSDVIELARKDGYLINENPSSEEIANQLKAGAIFGRCIGRSEFGARALGNRSILADPRRWKEARRINETIKSRDFWMPFAPTVLSRRVDDYFSEVKKHGNQFMTMGYRATELGQEHLEAATHPEDGTCRPQVLKRENNPGYYELIEDFERVTGVGALLNTSFNFHGEPIVQNPKDAYRIFAKSNLDGLLFEGFALTKKQG